LQGCRASVGARRAGITMLELEQFLPYRLSVLANTISTAIAGVYQQRFNLSVTEWRVLAVLGRYPDCSATEVAERIAMDKVAVSRAVAGLLKSGRIRRSTDNQDRRRSVLSLSAKGRRVYAQVVPLALAYEGQLLARLKSQEQAQLDRILAKLASANAA